MATAVQPTTPSQTRPTPVGLLTASFVGAAVVLAGLAIAVYAVPQYWDGFVSPILDPLGMPFLNSALRLTASFAVAAGFVFVAATVLGQYPPAGTRGGIFLIVSLAIGIAFIARAVGLNLEESNLAQYGPVITCAVLGGLLALAYRLLASDTGKSLMHAIESQGWLSLFHYKKTQGIKLRRYTLIGLLLIGLTGVYSLILHNTVSGDWRFTIPFTGGKWVNLFSDLGYTLPILLAGLTFWLAWRAVNVPPFADFLIATEAEMNKVSWSSRKRLIQDTIVVLSTLLLLTLFLLVVDFFWGWLLSQHPINVLPNKGTPTTANGKFDAVQGKIVDW